MWPQQDTHHLHDEVTTNTTLLSRLLESRVLEKIKTQWSMLIRMIPYLLFISWTEGTHTMAGVFTLAVTCTHSQQVPQCSKSYTVSIFSRNFCSGITFAIFVVIVQDTRYQKIFELSRLQVTNWILLLEGGAILY